MLISVGALRDGPEGDGEIGKRTVRSGVSVAVVETVIRLNEIVYAPFYALFIVDPVALLIEQWNDGRIRAGHRSG